MHRVVVLAVPPATSFDLSIPELVFGAAVAQSVLDALNIGALS